MIRLLKSLKPVILAIVTAGACILAPWSGSAIADDICNGEPKSGSDPIRYSIVSISVEIPIEEQAQIGDCIGVYYIPVTNNDPSNPGYILLHATVKYIIDKGLGSELIGIEVDANDAERLKLAQILGVLSVSPANVDDGENIDCASGDLTDACFIGPTWKDGNG